MNQDQMACSAMKAAALCDVGGRRQSENKAAPLDCFSVCKKWGTECGPY